MHHGKGGVSDAHLEMGAARGILGHECRHVESRRLGSWEHAKNVYKYPIPDRSLPFYSLSLAI